MKCCQISVRSALPLFTLSVMLAMPALAGPPLICHRFQIGSAQSLPWPNDTGNLVGRFDYDLSHLVADTLALLNSDTPVIVRMETLRRATIYAQRDSLVAKQLLLNLHARTTRNANDALAAFDLGYLVECYKQAQLAHRQGLRAWGDSHCADPAAGLDGYAIVKSAMTMHRQDAEMEFAAAMIASMQSGEDSRAHIDRAVAGAKDDPLLAQNLADNFGKKMVSERLAKATASN